MIALLRLFWGLSLLSALCLLSVTILYFANITSRNSAYVFLASEAADIGAAIMLGLILSYLIERRT